MPPPRVSLLKYQLLWTYVSPFPSVQDMEQLYEMWLKSQKPEKGEDPAPQANKENGKQIHMPTDYAEVTVSHRDRTVTLFGFGHLAMQCLLDDCVAFCQRRLS